MQLVIRRPDDFHVHFRDNEAMNSVVPYTARQFGRAFWSLRLPVGRLFLAFHPRSTN